VRNGLGKPKNQPKYRRTLHGSNQQIRPAMLRRDQALVSEIKSLKRDGFELVSIWDAENA
jgi:hypothetical protein